MAGPSFRAAPVRVRVPATSANLGPGFDALGLALALYDDVIVRVGDSGVLVDVAGEGADDVPRDKRNLVAKAVQAGFDAAGGRPRGVEIVSANRIPHGRGLGSSAAAVAAGVTAARHLVLGGIEDDAVLDVAARLEGHADNVTAALYGGLTLAWQGDGAPAFTRLDVHPAIVPVVFVPTARSSTAKARKLLPETVPHADAAAGAGRAALLVEALSRHPELLLPATHDVLHQPYRAEAMPRTADLVAGLRAQGLAAAVSGAGPSVLVLANGEEQAARALAHPAGRGWVVHRLAIDRLGTHVVPI